MSLQVTVILRQHRRTEMQSVSYAEEDMCP
jgi:hypothetical protein